MNYRIARSRRFLTLVSGILAGCLAADARAVILTSNLGLPQDGIELISKSRWLASEFKTDSDSYLIDSITLRLQQNVKGAVQVALFSDAGGRPGELLMTLNPTSGVGGTPSQVTFRGNGKTRAFNLSVSSKDIGRAFGMRGIDGTRLFGGPTRVRVTGERPFGLGLDADSTYWVVTRAVSGQFASGYTDQEQGDGVGYSSTWAHSENAGVSWTTERQSPLFLEVLANPADLLVTDQEAITSAIFSGLPMAMAQREAIFNMVRNVTRDVNERLFRLRSQTELSPVAAGPQPVEPASRWEAFATAGYGFADHETFLPAAGFETDTWAETVGAEYRVSDHITIGGAFTYVQSNNALALSVGDADIEGEALAAYISSRWGGFYADALYSFGMFEHDLQRDTFFGNTATAEPNSRTHTLQLNLGYTLPVAGFVTGPYASIDWMIGELESYEEANGNTTLGTARLRVPGQTFDSLISRIGWQISRTFAVESVKITPQLRAAWAHEYRDDQEAVDVQLARSPFYMSSADTLIPLGRFNASADTQAPGSDVLELGFAVGVEWQDRFSVIVDYGARVFQNNAFSQQVSLTGSVKF